MENKKPAVRRMDGPVRRPMGQPQAFDMVRPAAPKRVIPVQPRQETVANSGDLHEVDFGEIDANAINEAADQLHAMTEPKKRFKRLRKINRKHVAVTTLTVVVAFAGFVGFKAVMASSRVVTKAGEGAPVLKGEIDPTKLKGEGDGRINILLMGVGGGAHDGGQLSDTLMVASIDPAGKTVSMLSIPRDLYVKIPGRGYSKINAANAWGGPTLAKQVVGNILDLPVHYYVQADFAGFRQAVDAVGGVQITNKTKLYDGAYPCDSGRGYCIFSMTPGVHQLDGTTALKYARCRHGSCGSDFGRAERQQQLLMALREKSLEASTLTNPVKLSGLIDSFGDHVRTDLQPNEWEKLANIVKDIDPTKSTTKVLDTSSEGLLVDGSGRVAGAGSILVPRAGMYDYSEIQELAHSLFVDGYLKAENAAVEIQNGTERDGLAAAVSRQLKAYHYNVVGAKTSEQPAQESRIIDYTGGKKPYTVQYLQKRFRAQVQQSSTPPPASGTTDSSTQPDIVIIIGSNYNPSSLDND